MPLYEVTMVFYPKDDDYFGPGVLVGHELRDVQVVLASDVNTARGIAAGQSLKVHGLPLGDITVRKEVDDEWVDVPTDEEDTE